LDGLARSYEASGDTEQAARWLKALNDSPEALGWEPQQDWLASFVRLARVNSMQAKKDDAKAVLAHFLDLRKDADPDIPLWKQAQAEYAKLQ
jgi:eukaryotic-like serine/threonine-protein kinase